jgi:IS30 family transposase
VASRRGTTKEHPDNIELQGWYESRGGDFSSRVSEDELYRAVKRLNHRPRKCLGYRTPYEVIREALGGALAN